MQTFKVENYKGIRGTVEVSTNGGSVIVQGNNAAGKSSFIDAITELFDARGLRLTPRPINDGADEAVAEFTDTSLDVKVVRTWKRTADGKSSSTIAVYALDGAKHKKPSEVIAQLTGGTIFDPSKFLLLDPAPQRDALLRKVELPFDLDALEREQEAAEEIRLQMGQAARAAEGAVTNADRPAPDTPSEPVSTSDLVAELEKARQNNSDLQRAEDLHKELLKQAEIIDDRIDALRSQIRELEDDRADVIGRSEDAKLKADSLSMIDTAELESKVQNVDEINKNVQLRKIHDSLELVAGEKREEYEDAKKSVQAIIKRKEDGLRKAVFPHPKLSIDDDGVLFDGVPFNQVNTGQREEAAFAIATSGSPDLRLVIVKNGDLLDENSLAYIDRVARERDYTILVERGRPDVGGLVATFVEMKDGVAA